METYNTEAVQGAEIGRIECGAAVDVKRGEVSPSGFVAGWRSVFKISKKFSPVVNPHWSPISASSCCGPARSVAPKLKNQHCHESWYQKARSVAPKVKINIGMNHDIRRHAKCIMIESLVTTILNKIFLTCTWLWPSEPRSRFEMSLYQLWTSSKPVYKTFEAKAGRKRTLQ